MRTGVFTYGSAVGYLGFDGQMDTCVASFTDGIVVDSALVKRITNSPRVTGGDAAEAFLRSFREVISH